MSTPCVFHGCTNSSMPSLDKCSFHRYRSKCKVESCFNQVYARRLCVCHGGKKVCEFPTCFTTVRTGNFCARHTKKSKPTCSEQGCQLPSYVDFKCIRHCGGKACLIEDCAMPVRLGNFCWRHRNRVELSNGSEDVNPLLLLVEHWMNEESIDDQEDDIFRDIFDDFLVI